MPTKLGKTEIRVDRATKKKSVVHHYIKQFSIKNLIEKHNMEPHPEGGHYVEIFRNDDVTHIYFLLEEHENSHWHRITKTETLHFYSGSPLNVYTSKDGVEFQIDEIGSNNNFMYTVEKLSLIHI